MTDCYWLQDEVCVNDRSRYCADFPRKADCKRCPWYEAEEAGDNA